MDVALVCFTPLYFGIEDYCGIVLDIPKASLLGGDTQTIYCPTARRLKCYETKLCSTYNEKLGIYLKQHRVKKKIKYVQQYQLQNKIKLRMSLSSINKLLAMG